ncbi:MAG: ATP-binding cassette domain-containing protein [Chitinivibrionales bacterium]|nr:ATP-binding cassette domain-containing protein [Chitinivibrionales bacterium]
MSDTSLANNTGIVKRGDTIVSVNNVSKIFKLKKNEVHALKNISVEIKSGEYLSIMGPSGSGKSTLFNMIGALDSPSKGNVEIGPLDLTKLSSSQLAYVRCNYIGYIFQAYNLIPSLTALKNVALAHVFTGATEEEADAAAKKCLELVGLGHRLDHRPDELSGGQQQRVAIARSLVNDPTIMLADEPTANLDFNTGAEIIGILKKLSIEQGVTVITATHDHKMLKNSDRILWIKDGAVDHIDNAEDLHIDEGAVSSLSGGDELENLIEDNNRT